MDNEAYRYLTRHYEHLADARYDFRNYNLAELLVSYIRDIVNDKGLKEDHYIVDIGCGSGFLVELLRQKGFNALGIEPNEELIKLSKKLYPEIQIRHGSLENLNTVGKRFDVVIMADVLEHVEDDGVALNNLASYLTEGGVLICVVPAHPFLYGKRDVSYGHVRRYSKTTLLRRLINAGFDPLKIHYWNMLGFLPYLISERILGRGLETKLRKRQEQLVGRMINKILHFWFYYIENKINFGWGLSLICVAKKSNVPRIVTQKTSY